MCNLLCMKKMKGEGCRKEGREGTRIGMLNQRQKLATSYTSLGGYSFRAGPAQASSPGPPSLREVDGLLGPRAAQARRKIGGISALGARTIFRLSLRECQPDREQIMLKRTPSASGSRPWSRGGEGRGVERSFLRVVLVHVQVVLHCFQQ